MADQRMGLLELLRKAYEDSRHAMARNLLEQLQVAMLGAKVSAPCQVTGLGRPRRQDGGQTGPSPGCQPSSWDSPVRPCC